MMYVRMRSTPGLTARPRVCTFPVTTRSTASKSTLESTGSHAVSRPLVSLSRLPTCLIVGTDLCLLKRFLSSTPRCMYTHLYVCIRDRPTSLPFFLPDRHPGPVVSLKPGRNALLQPRALRLRKRLRVTDFDLCIPEKRPRF